MADAGARSTQAAETQAPQTQAPQHAQNDQAPQHPQAPQHAHAPQANLVSFAGLDGAGKTTQARLLAEWLATTGCTVGLEAPQGPSFIRSVLTELARELGVSDHHQVFGPDITHLLTAFMRYRDWAERVMPALRTHQWMITDRSAVCHYAAAYAVGATNDHALRTVMSRLPVPDLILLLDISPEDAFNRLALRNAGREEAAFLEANARGYRRLPEFADFAIVDGSGSIPEVSARVRQAVSQRFPELLAAAGPHRPGQPGQPGQLTPPGQPSRP